MENNAKGSLTHGNTRDYYHAHLSLILGFTFICLIAHSMRAFTVWLAHDFSNKGILCVGPGERKYRVVLERKREIQVGGEGMHSMACCLIGPFIFFKFK